MHNELKGDLKDLAKKIETELGWSNVRFVQAGSSVPGYSSNPCKGLAYLPSKITSPDKSDVDIVVVAKGIEASVQAVRAADGEIKIKEYPSVVPPGKDPNLRYGFKPTLGHYNATLAAFSDKWGEKLCVHERDIFCRSDS